ncbi:MAG TPA: deoxyhypusine synthase family protein [Gemmatimonadaceae bacterium]|jgi:deoxyhypusine synthase
MSLFDTKAPLRRSPGPFGRILETDFQGYNAATTVEAAQMWVRLLEQDGDMFVTLAGAMSTAQIGITLARMIRERNVCAIGCTGANLEEDLFNLVGFNSYTYLPNYANLTPEQEMKLAKAGHPRVTDSTIPEVEAMKPVGDALTAAWKAADAAGVRKFPYEFLYDVIRSGVLADKYEGNPANSWLLAAADMNIPIFTPGWEDSTTGNLYAGLRAKGEVKNKTVRDGTEWFEEMGNWYRAAAKKTPIGFFQIGGGIAGDGPICVVPYLLTEMQEKKTPFWASFTQITDAHVSYGGYSGAQPREKITWSKLDVDTPTFDIHSDATIVAPLIFRYVLGD